MPLVTWQMVHEWSTTYQNNRRVGSDIFKIKSDTRVDNDLLNVKAYVDEALVFFIPLFKIAP